MALRILLGLAAALLTTGFGLIWLPLAFITAGLCILLYTLFFVLEVGPKVTP